MTLHLPCRFLLVAGKPIGESVVQHGPFVMNTEGDALNIIPSGSDAAKEAD